VVTYNVPEITRPLRLDGPTLADIYLGKITKWNDARIATLNPGLRLPASDILVVHRSDGSGTSYVFTDYLSSVSPSWAEKPGKGKEVQWPVGLGGKGNEGVAGQVKQLPGSIGYVELAYAKQNKLAYANIRNAQGAYVTPTIEAVTAAAAGAAAKLPANTDYRISIVNAPGKGAYPISSFTWLLVYRQQTDAVKSKKLVDFVKWALTEGEKSAATLDYAPIPSAMSRQLVKQLGAVTVAAK
jgi:phosphate transport system substrate-binding protein